MSALCLGPCRPAEHGGPRQTGKGGRLCDICRERMWQNLHTIAETWDDLVARLASEGSSALTERVQSTSDPGLNINELVSDAMREAMGWLSFVGRVVMEEREVGEPKDTTAPGLARWLASTHLDWMATHHDEQMAAGFAQEAAHHAKMIQRRAYPSGARLIDMPWMKCTEHVIANEDGERLPCPGHLTAWIKPQGGLPDLVCNLEPLHRFDPATWQRRGWKSASIDPAAAEKLARAIFGESLASGQVT